MRRASSRVLLVRKQAWSAPENSCAFEERFADIVQGVIPFPRLRGPHVLCCISLGWQGDRLLKPLKNIVLGDGH